MLQLINKTPYAPAMFLFPDEHGVDTMYAVAKATFDISTESPTLAETQTPVQLADEYFGEPGASSVKYASEAHLMKPGTDVVVVGEAVAPGGKAVLALDVVLAVDDRKQRIHVVGDRQWKGTGLKAWAGDPEPFSRMPLIYERAFGGMQSVERSDGTTEVYAEPANPVGVGFRGKRSFEEIQVEPVPNLEHPDAPVTAPKSKGTPVGFGFVAPWWSPRIKYIGTYDAAWQRNRAPYLPKDFDNRFFNVAPAGWVFEAGLKGGEPVFIENMSDRGAQGFELPAVSVGFEVVVAGRTVRPEARLETVLIEPGEAKMCLTYRASVPCDKKALEVSEVRIV